MAVVVTSLLTAKPDPQRPTGKLPATLEPITELAESLLGTYPLVVLADEITPGTYGHVEVVATPSAQANVYMQRWINTITYLRTIDALDVWLVDGTDVELINPAPPITPGRLWLGHEPAIVGCQWMLDNHPSHRGWVSDHQDLTLMNPGIIGGTRATVIAWLEDVVREWESADRTGDVGDMATINAVAHMWRDRIDYGPRLVTVFRQQQRNDFSAWRHK